MGLTVLGPHVSGVTWVCFTRLYFLSECNTLKASGQTVLSDCSHSQLHAVTALAIYPSAAGHAGYFPLSTPTPLSKVLL